MRDHNIAANTRLSPVMPRRPRRPKLVHFKCPPRPECVRYSPHSHPNVDPCPPATSFRRARPDSSRTTMGSGASQSAIGPFRGRSGSIFGCATPSQCLRSTFVLFPWQLPQLFAHASPRHPLLPDHLYATCLVLQEQQVCRARRRRGRRLWLWLECVARHRMGETVGEWTGGRA